MSKFINNVFIAALLLITATGYALNCNDYPHWDCKDPKLKTIDAFILKHADKGLVAAFDWDGTLYDEHIMVKEGDYHSGEQRSGQSVWHLWGARQNVFPLFITADNKSAENVVSRDDFVEGETRVSPTMYSKFNFIAITEAGLSPQEFYSSEDEYLARYPAKDYAFLPMLDIYQQLKNKGYQLWIITGSNPYFVNNILHSLDETLGYHLLDKQCQPNNFRIENCNIIGNAAKLSPNGKFSFVYDDRFVRSQHPRFITKNRHIINGKGKEIAIKNYLIPRSKKPIALYAGNSGGDLEAMRYVLSQPNISSLGITVNASGSLKNLVTESPLNQKIIRLRVGPQSKSATNYSGPLI